MRPAGGWLATASSSSRLRSEVLSSAWRAVSIFRASSKILVAFFPVRELVITTGANGMKLKSRVRVSRIWSVPSLSRSVLVTTRIIPFPASMISPARLWSSLQCGSVLSTSRQQTSASSIAARVRSAENFSMPTSLLPGRRRPAVSSNSMLRPLYLIVVRLTSRVVPARFATTACCFLAKVLKRELLPTFGRPIRASLSG